VQRGANLDDGAGLAGEVSADAPGKRILSGRCVLAAEAKPAPSGAAARTGDPNRLKPLRQAVIRPIQELESEAQYGNSGKRLFFQASEFLVPPLTVGQDIRFPGLADEPDQTLYALRCEPTEDSGVEPNLGDMAQRLPRDC